MTDEVVIETERRNRMVTTIQEAVVGFDWHNYGMDEVAAADPEYAEHLAREILACLLIMASKERAIEPLV